MLAIAPELLSDEISKDDEAKICLGSYLLCSGASEASLCSLLDETKLGQLLSDALEGKDLRTAIFKSKSKSLKFKAKIALLYYNLIDHDNKTFAPLMSTLIHGNIFTGVLKPGISLKYLHEEVNVDYSTAVFIEQLELIKAGTIESIRVEDLQKMKSL